MPGTFVEVPDVAEFVVVQSLDGQVVNNVYHVKKEGGWDSASMAAMAVVFISFYNDDLAPLLSNHIQFVKVKCRDLTTVAGAIAEVNFPALSGGDNNVIALPAQCSASCQHTTGVAGRSYRGRTSVAGITIGSVNNNLLQESVATAVTDAFDALDAAIISAGGTWGIVSKYSGYTWSPPPYRKIPTPRAEGIFTDIINSFCSRRIGSQDSRNN